MFVQTLSGNFVSMDRVVSVNVKEKDDGYVVEVETVLGNRRKVFAGTQEECKAFAEGIAK